MRARRLTALLAVVLLLCGCQGQVPGGGESAGSQAAPVPGAGDSVETTALPYEILNFYSYDDAEGIFAYRNRGTGEYGYLDMWGNEVRPEEELELVQIAQDQGRYGILHSDGSWALEAKYDWIGDFTEGFAPFRQEGLWGYLDWEGREAIPAQYLSAWNFSEGLAAVELLATDVDPREKLVGYIDTEGNMVIKPRVMSTYGVGQFSSGLARISVGDFPDYRDVYIDRQGNEVFRCYRGNNFYEGVAIVTLYNEEWRPAEPDSPYYMYETAVINSAGEFIYRPPYPSVGQGRDDMDTQYLSDGYLAVTDYTALQPDPNGDFYNLTGYESYVDENGRIGFDPQRPVERSTIPVIYINNRGESLGVRNYASQFITFSGGRAYYEDADGACGYIDTTGQLAIDLAKISEALGTPVTRSPSNYGFGAGYTRFSTDTGTGLIDLDGNIVLAPVPGGIQGWYRSGGDMVVWLAGGTFIGLDGAVRFSIQP